MGPRVQDTVHAEVDRVLCGRLPEYEDLPKLTYTEAVINVSWLPRQP